MPDNPIQDKTNEPVATSLEYSLAQLRQVLRMPQNATIGIRRLTIADFSCALIHADGMVNQSIINMDVLEPAQNAPAYDGPPSGRVDWLLETVLTASQIRLHEKLDDVVSGILAGDVALLVDGCPLAIMVDAKGFPRRDVGRSANEAAIVGPQEAFVENLRMNIALIRRILRTPRLVTEQIKVGTGIPADCALIYLDGVANEQILAEARRRLNGINMDCVLNAGELEQYIEDSPYALLPQFIRTERPDRVASYLVSGMAVIMIDGDPDAIACPSSFVHLMHSATLTNLRFPYSTFRRWVYALGICVTTYLPALFLSLVMYHNEVLPLALMTSIFETQSRVPVPLMWEIIFLSLGFDLIIEAASRMPMLLSSGLGVVSALILGQAVVAADLVSPLMIVVVALSCLGFLMTQDYALAISVRMLQNILILGAALGGFFGILLLSVLMGVEFLSMTSMGVPMTWPTSPLRMHNPDLVTRGPLWQQRLRHYLSNPSQLFRAKGRVRAWEKEDQRNGK